MATHTHRVGRTGRANETGWAFSLAGMDEMALAGHIEQAGGSSSEWHALDTLTPAGGEPLRPSMATRQIPGGRKKQVRAGDVPGSSRGAA
jgi:ATP-independent RNA helicase DbpA